MRKKILYVPMAAAGALLIASGAGAGEPVRAVATGGISYGGDDWQVASSSNGNPLNIHGGGRFALGLGAAWEPATYPLMASLVANYHFDTRAGANTSAKFTRAPVDAMMYYTGMAGLRAGVGLNYILSPEVKATVDGTEQTVRFKNALGKSFELGYEVAPQLWANLRLSSEKFKPRSAGTAREADVSHLAINLSYLF